MWQKNEFEKLCVWEKNIRPIYIYIKKIKLINKTRQVSKKKIYANFTKKKKKLIKLNFFAFNSVGSKLYK